MRRLALLCVALLAAGCYDSRFGERGDDATPEPVTATIRQLREKFAGTTFPVTGDIVVSGRVTPAITTRISTARSASKRTERG